VRERTPLARKEDNMFRVEIDTSNAAFDGLNRYKRYAAVIKLVEQILGELKDGTTGGGRLYDSQDRVVDEPLIGTWGFYDD